MKKIATYTVMTGILIVLVSVGWAMEGMEGHGGHQKGKMEGHGSKMQGMDHSKHMGQLIRETTIDGFALAYHLIDMQKHTQGMKMAGTHHLMVYIKSADGKTSDQAKVGYLIVNPDGKEQKAMTMGMTGGFGADVSLKDKGTYKITAKALVDGKKLVDTFDYIVK